MDRSEKHIWDYLDVVVCRGPFRHPLLSIFVSSVAGAVSEQTRCRK